MIGMSMGGMGGYAFGQQAMRPTPGALNWNPGYGAGPFMPKQVQSGMRAFQSGRGIAEASPAPFVNPQLVNAIAAGTQQDEEERDRNAARIKNIRDLRMAFLQALTNAELRGRGLDLQELRLMNQ